MQERAMKMKDILTITTTGAPNEHVIAAAEQIARQNAGKVIGLVVGWLPPVSLSMEGWAVTPVWGDITEESRKELAAELLRVKTRLDAGGLGRDVESELLEMSAGRIATGLRGRHADITVVGRPHGDFDQAIVEGPLFESGRPVLIVPPNWKPREIGRSVLVCWKPTREAARALGDADDFLVNASQVTVVTIDARPSADGYGPRPGVDITAHLARRGVKVELVNLDSLGRSVANVIHDQALAMDADLIVMGGYGRSRMSEFIFGGMTREMLKMAEHPVLMAH
jgi:nucleotide-binding universal stress UspA family protein